MKRVGEKKLRDLDKKGKVVGVDSFNTPLDTIDLKQIKAMEKLTTAIKDLVSKENKNSNDITALIGALLKASSNNVPVIQERIIEEDKSKRSFRMKINRGEDSYIDSIDVEEK